MRLVEFHISIRFRFSVTKNDDPFVHIEPKPAELKLVTEIDRRRLLLGGAALTGATWVAPAVLALDHVAAATGSLGSVITGSSGVTFLDPPPASMALNVLESDVTTFVVAESECTVLPNDIVVNRSTPGSFSGNSNELTVIPAGTAVCSFFVSADRANSGSLIGSLTFANPILGLIYEVPQFNATTPVLGVPGMTYPTPNGAFIEGNDSFVLSTNSVEWTLAMGGVWSDVMRVVIAC